MQITYFVSVISFYLKVSVQKQKKPTNRSLLTAPDHSSLKNYRSENQDREVASTKQFPETHKLKYYIFMKTFLKIPALMICITVYPAYLTLQFIKI